MELLTFYTLQWEKEFEKEKGVSEGKTGFFHPFFNKFREEECLQYLTSTIEIEEGLLQCKKCSSKQIHIIQKQTRSADEPMTIFAQCSKCNHRWTQ